MDQVEARIKATLSEILDVEENDIGLGFGPDDTDTWDSLHNLMLITELEREFCIELAMNDIEKMVNFAEIKRVIERYVN